MKLYYYLIIAIWLCVLYAIWAATAAGDPGYGQISFLIVGIAATLYLRKRKLERPRIDDKKIEIPKADFAVEIPDEGDKYFFSESNYRKIIWITTIFALMAISFFLESITTRKNIILGTISLILGLIAFLIPILLPVKDDIKTLKKRAQKERTKAWHKGKFDLLDEEK